MKNPKAVVSVALVAFVAALTVGVGAQSPAGGAEKPALTPDDYVYTSIEVPGATKTAVFGINSDGVVAGRYWVGSVSHGFHPQRLGRDDDRFPRGVEHGGLQRQHPWRRRGDLLSRGKRARVRVRPGRRDLRGDPGRRGPGPVCLRHQRFRHRPRALHERGRRLCELPLARWRVHRTLLHRRSVGGRLWPERPGPGGRPFRARGRRGRRRQHARVPARPRHVHRDPAAPRFRKGRPRSA